MKHAPTPWFIQPLEWDKKFWEIVSNDKQSILGNEAYYPWAPEREDAEFIVRAVNTHEELLEAAKKTVKAFEDILEREFIFQKTDLLKMKDPLEKAIRKAEGMEEK